MRTAIDTRVRDIKGNKSELWNELYLRRQENNIAQNWFKDNSLYER